jgi:F-type H+-transporting ATPase subunit alpha
VTNGFLDTIPVNRIRAWERDFLDYARTQFPQVGDTIRSSKALSKDTEADLKRAIESFTQMFAATK